MFLFPLLTDSLWLDVDVTGKQTWLFWLAGVKEKRNRNRQMRDGHCSLSSVSHYGCLLYMNTRFSLRLHRLSVIADKETLQWIQTLAACLTFSAASLLRKLCHCCTGFWGFFLQQKKESSPLLLSDPPPKLKEIKWPFLPTRAGTVSWTQAKGDTRCTSERQR